MFQLQEVAGEQEILLLDLQEHLHLDLLIQNMKEMITN
jgi:hypothetical protein